MSWFAVDDGLNHNDKWAELLVRFEWDVSALATAVWLRAGSACARRKEPSFTKAQAVVLVAGTPRDKVYDALSALVDVGLVEESNGLFLFINWDKYNGSEEARRAAEAERKRLSRAKLSADCPALSADIPDTSQDRPVTSRGPASPSPSPSPSPKQETPNLALAETASPSRTVFEFWQKETGHEHSKFDVKRKRLVEARLKEGYTVEQLCDAIRACVKDPWYRGKNDRNKVFDSLNMICRDAAKVDELLALLPKNAKPKNELTPRQDQAVWRLENGAMLYDDDADILKEMGLL